MLNQDGSTLDLTRDPTSKCGPTDDIEYLPPTQKKKNGKRSKFGIALEGLDEFFLHEY